MVFLFSYGVYTTLLLAILRKVWPYPEGIFSMESRQFTYWKLISVLADLGGKAWWPFITVFNQGLVYKAFGARLGKKPAFGGTVRDLPLVEFGDGCTIGQDSVITAHAITRDQIVFARVRIGTNAVVGINCVVMPGVEIGEGTVLAPGAVATIGTKMPPYELWGGIPARKLKDLPKD
jgi:acetyltransferase-like isoleucine patch superfamily enzyme